LPSLNPMKPALLKNTFKDIYSMIKLIIERRQSKNLLNEVKLEDVKQRFQSKEDCVSF